MKNGSPKENDHIKVDVAASGLADGNWRTIDNAILFDGNKCDLGGCDLNDLYRVFGSSPQGLKNDSEVTERREKFGPNKIEIKERHPILRFLLFMWNPLSWVMEIAALVAIAVSNGGGKPPDWPDFLGIVLLLLLNSAIGYFEESRAGSAVKALMASLAPECRVKRNNGVWSTVEASELVPGDIISIKLGNIVPADARIISALSGTVSIDQAALTGESLPVTKEVGGKLLSSAVCKQGECEAIVIATGKNTFFGRAADIVGSARDEVGHLQKILARIGNFCMVGIALFIVIEILVMYAGYRYDYRRGIDNILVLLIGGLPIAMPTVLSVTMAIGAKQLSEKQTIVTRITAIEELAAVTILCSDKTGTLTLNKLIIDKETIIQYTDATPNDIIRYAAYASNREHSDAIDTCVMQSYGDADSIDGTITIKSFIPFDPTNKRTEVTYIDKATGNVHRVTKGMPEAIIKLCSADQAESSQQFNKIRADVKEFARRGFRALAVAIDKHGGTFQMVGLLPILDPPREDTGETIKKAIELGVQVKMITGDQLEIAKETGRRLGMGDAMFVYDEVMKSTTDHDSLDKDTNLNIITLYADGFASVFPEHKYKIVKRLQELDHMVAMTGDGVNDAPALSKANVGVAVADACDAARSAAAIVLTQPGLSVIIDAILGSRQIFARMNSYATYTCSITIRIIVSFALLIFIFRYDFPPFLVLIIAVCNDGTMMTIAKDRVEPSPIPNRWRLKRIFISAIVYGLYLAASTLVFFAIITQTDFLKKNFNIDNIVYDDSNRDNTGLLNSVIYLQVSIISQALIFITRSQGFFFTERPTILLVFAFVVAQLVSTFIAVYADWGFTRISGCGWGLAAFTWVYDIIWFFPLDLVKFGLQASLSQSLSTIKPFSQCCGHKFTMKSKKNAVEPEDLDYCEMPPQRLLLRKATIKLNDIQKDVITRTKQKTLIDKIDEYGELGSPYYKPHTEIFTT